MMHLVSLLLISLSTGAEPLNNLSSSLTVYVYPPHKAIDWSTPKSTIDSMLTEQVQAMLLDDQAIDFVSDFGDEGHMSSIYHSTMGHTIGHVNYTLPDGQQYERWTSFTGQNYSAVDANNLLRKKLGAGVLFYDYIDGEILAGQENYDRLTFYHGGRNGRGHNRPRYLQFEIDGPACAQVKNMVEFFESFHHPKMTPEELEKLPPEKRLYFSAQLDPFATYLARQSDPLAKVGGGCAPYGVALMKIAGRYQDALEGFFRRRLDR